MTSILEIANLSFGNARLCCGVGNLIDVDVDAIAISTDSKYTLDFGVGKAIKNAGGRSLMKFVSNANISNPAGSILVVPEKIGQIKAKNILFVPIRNYDRMAMEKVYHKILQKAMDLGFTSLAMPLIGTGLFNVQLSHAVDALISTIKRVDMGSLQILKFIDLNEASIRYLANALNSSNIPSLKTTATNILPSSSNSLNVQDGHHSKTSSGSNTDTSGSKDKVLESSSDDDDESSSDSSDDTDDSEMESDDDDTIDDALFEDLYGDSTDENTNENSSDVVIESGDDDDDIMEVLASSTSMANKEASDSAYWTFVSIDKLREKLMNRSATDKARNSRKKSKFEPTQPCSICLSELILEDDPDNSGCNAQVVKLKLCSHLFHMDCISQAFEVKKQCPLCMTWYGAAAGNQPQNATMSVSLQNGHIPGFASVTSYHLITYYVPAGTQTEGHIRPGLPYSSTTRHAYLPNNREGCLVLKMLQLAFERRLIFTIGDSVTSGMKNVPVWNGIHHKTRIDGGSQNYGYPDDSYFERVKNELAAFGIEKSMVE